MSTRVDFSESNQDVIPKYRLSLVEEEKMSKEFLNQNVANTQLSLRFSTNTIMKYKEVKVVILKSSNVHGSQHCAFFAGF